MLRQIGKMQLLDEVGCSGEENAPSGIVALVALEEQIATADVSVVVKAIRDSRGQFMTRSTVILALGLAFALNSSPTLVAEDDHLAEAIRHTKQAIDQDRQDRADVGLTHAESALAHAEVAAKQRYNLYIDEGVTQLRMAIAQGIHRNAQLAADHATEALANFKEAKKAEE
ncbi:small metal-binding protein SmbP [Methylocystis suflitae]|uniref:small metal-binding protein SmbP n=1 Tax=Methylocystis suflitae TaxID=2951405 RepID=UPI00210BC436|nr:small metal-binding protein SmbP [Methylocystis suflitae]MCQ4190984.1 hypothetical protein [Methylocystis suflitae]